MPQNNIAVGGAGLPSSGGAAGVLNALAAGTVKGDGVTDDSAALQALINAHPGHTIYLPSTAPNPMGGGLLHPSYYCAQSLTLSAPGTVLCGDGTNTAVKFAAGVAGVKLAADKTVVRDLALLGSEPWTGANGSRWWEGVIPAQRYPGLTAASGASAADGVQIAANDCLIANLYVSGFGRDGINVSEGDIPCVANERPRVEFVTVNNCRGNGIRVQGQDSNVGLITAPNVNANQFWGIDFQPFLGGVVVTPQADQNGYDSSPYDPSNGAFAPVYSVSRAAGTVTLTFAAAYPAPAFAPGAAVEVAACGDPSFVGRWRVTGVAADGQGRTVLTYTQTGTMTAAAAPDASPAAAVTLTGTPQTNADAGTQNLTNRVTLPSTNGLAPGMYVFGPGVRTPTSSYFYPPPTVKSVDSATQVTLSERCVAAGAAPFTFTTCYAAYNYLPPDGKILSAARNGTTGVVTLTFSGTYAVDGSAAGLGPVPFQVGHGVTLSNCPDPSFNGTFVVQSVATQGGNTVLTYNQAGATATITSGTARLAVPRDTWAAAGLTTGAYRSPNTSGSQNVWVGVYVEGGQTIQLESNNLVLAASKSDPLAGALQLQAMMGGNSAPGTNTLLGIAADRDGDMSARCWVGKTASGTAHWYWDDMRRVAADPSDTGKTAWSQHVYPDQSAGRVQLCQGDPSQPGAVYREDVYYGLWSKYNSTGGAPVYVNNDAGTGPGLVVGDGTGPAPTGTGHTTTVNGGSVLPTPIPDSAAPNGSYYVSTDHPNAGGHPSFTFKDSSGAVTVLGAELDANGYVLLKTGSGPPTTSPADGASYLDVAAARFYLRAGGAWKSVALS